MKNQRLSRSSITISAQTLNIQINKGDTVKYIFKIIDTSNVGNAFNFYVNNKYKTVLLNIKSGTTVNVQDETFNTEGVYTRNIKVQNSDMVFSNTLTFNIVVNSTSDTTQPNNEQQYKIIGANRSVWSTDVEQVCSSIRNLKLNTITLSCKFNIPSLTSNTVLVDNIDLSFCKKILDNLASDGILNKIKVIFEPYPYISSGNDYETEFNPSEPTVFLSNWKIQIINALNSLKSYKFFGVYVNSNMDSLINYTSTWQDIYNSIKAIVPNSNVMIRTNFWITAEWSQDTINLFQEKIKNKYFLIFDIIAIAAYFELANVATATENQIYQWIVNGTTIYNRNQKIRDEVKLFATTCNKKILFGELGCASYRYAVKEPWNVSPSSTVDQTTQANLFKAYYKAFISDIKNEDWFLGFSVFAIGDSGHYDIYNKEAGNYIMSLNGISLVE